jgi:hypothetical protein
MLALIYLAVMMVLGACLCRRFYRFSSLPHYVAASFLVGLLLSTWATYLFAFPFAWSDKPLLGANVLFFAFAGLAIYRLGPRSALSPELAESRPPGTAKWDAIFIAAFFLLACYLMFGTLSLSDGKVRLAFVVWNDFGPNLSLVQSFAMGHNFPTEYPHFIGHPIHYHFLFWFQGGNLEFLGLNIAWAVNLISVFSFLAMLILIMMLGELLFNSRAVGRIAAAMFFFPSTLAYNSFLRSQGSWSRALDAVIHLNHWLASGYPYRGEDWGTWSLGVFYVQRHLLVAIGILLMVLIFLVELYRQRANGLTPADARASGDAQEANGASMNPQVSEEWTTYLPVDAETPAAQDPSALKNFIFSGFLLGLLPMWNGAVFVAAFAVLAVLFILFPLKKQMLALGITAGVFALPQLIYLSKDAGGPHGTELFHWGYTLDQPTLWNVIKYLGFTFGFKWLLIAIALVLATRLQRRLFVAASSLILVAFLFQFSVEVLANHKFLNIWLIIANLFVAFILWKIGKSGLAGKAAAVALAIVVGLGGFIEWFRIHNDTIVDVPFNQSRLSEWLLAGAKPTDVFLTDRFVLDPILLNGRRIFYGWPYFAWSMGYPTAARDILYKKMFTTKTPSELVSLLNDNGIRYVAIDNGLRSGEFRSDLNEAVYKRYFKTVFEDKENLYGSLMIYQVPACICEGV